MHDAIGRFVRLCAEDEPGVDGAGRDQSILCRPAGDVNPVVEQRDRSKAEGGPSLVTATFFLMADDLIPGQKVEFLAAYRKAFMGKGVRERALNAVCVQFSHRLGPLRDLAEDADSIALIERAVGMGKPANRWLTASGSPVSATRWRRRSG